jgi:hypothetical protein
LSAAAAIIDVNELHNHSCEHVCESTARIRLRVRKGYEILQKQLNFQHFLVVFLNKVSL